MTPLDRTSLGRGQLSRRRLVAGVGTLALATLVGCRQEPAPPDGASATPTGSTPAGSTVQPSTPRSTASSPPSTSATPSISATPSPTGPVKPRIDQALVTGLNVPWGIAFLSSGDALVSERDRATIIRVDSYGATTTLGEVAGVAPRSGSGEGGLLGIALAPDDEDTLFAYLTTRSDNRVVRLSIANGKVGKPHPILTGIPTSAHHHGGRLLFAPDGMLFVSVGDAERSSLAQDRGSLAGKILRITPEGDPAPGNPFDNRTWSYGHRNVEGLAFDADGRLWATEFGEKESDELNIISKGGNYGWPEVEGDSDDKKYVAPQATWSPTSSCSPAGLAITRSTAFVGALQGRCMFSLALSGDSAGKPVAHFAGDHGRIRNVVLAPDGALWLTTSNTDGRATPGKDDDMIIRVTL